MGVLESQTLQMEPSAQGTMVLTPYQVVEQIGFVAFKLALPEGCRVHPVFHVSKLKKAVAADYVSQPLRAAITNEWVLQPELEDVMELRYNSH